MTRIAIDVDDTLYDFNALARNVMVDMTIELDDPRFRYGAYCPWGEWRQPVDALGYETWMNVIDQCHEPEMILAQVPYVGAAEVVNELAEQHELVYISTRNPERHEPTLQWLKDHDFPEAPLTCSTLDKAHYLRECQYLIDDRPKTLVEFVFDFHWKHMYGSEFTEKARQAFGLYTPYNAALTDVPGIKLAPNWKLLRQYLIKQEILRSAVGTAS